MCAKVYHFYAEYPKSQKRNGSLELEFKVVVIFHVADGNSIQDTSIVTSALNF